MSWGFDDLVDTFKDVAPAALGIAGAATGNPWLIGAGMGAGALFGGKKKPASRTSTTTETRKSTPVQWRTPSGKIVTLYAHGPSSQTTTETASPADGGALEGMSDPLSWASLYQKLTQGQALGITPPAALGAAGGGSGGRVDFPGNPSDFGGGMANLPHGGASVDSEWARNFALNAARRRG